MGQIMIETWGSFGHQKRIFSAQDHGHAHAVAEALAYLSAEVLPDAINADHHLHETGAKPDKGFTV